MRGAMNALAAPAIGFRLAYASCHPPRRASTRPGPPSFAPEEVAIPADGGTLAGWLGEADPLRIVVVGHGLGQDKSRSLRWAEFLHAAGYTVLMFDFRNHGASFADRSLTAFNKRFVRDVVAAVGWVRGRFDAPGTRVALYGFSLASFAMLHAVAVLDDQVDAVICDSGPSDRPAETTANLLESGVLPVPETRRDSLGWRALAATYRRCSRVMMGWPAVWPPRATIPMLLLTGGADRLVPPGAVRRVADASVEAEVVEFPGAGHMRLMASDRERYVRTVLAFVARTIGTSAKADR